MIGLIRRSPGEEGYPAGDYSFDAWTWTEDEKLLCMAEQVLLGDEAGEVIESLHKRYPLPTGYDPLHFTRSLHLHGPLAITSPGPHRWSRDGERKLMPHRMRWFPPQSGGEGQHMLVLSDILPPLLVVSNHAEVEAAVALHKRVYMPSAEDSMLTGMMRDTSSWRSSAGKYVLLNKRLWARPISRVHSFAYGSETSYSYHRRGSIHTTHAVEDGDDPPALYPLYVTMVKHDPEFVEKVAKRRVAGRGQTLKNNEEKDELEKALRERFFFLDTLDKYMNHALAAIAPEGATPLAVITKETLSLNRKFTGTYLTQVRGLRVPARKALTEKLFPLEAFNAALVSFYTNWCAYVRPLVNHDPATVDQKHEALVEAMVSGNSYHLNNFKRFFNSNLQYYKEWRDERAAQHKSTGSSGMPGPTSEEVRAAEALRQFWVWWRCSTARLNQLWSAPLAPADRGVVQEDGEGDRTGGVEDGSEDHCGGLGTCVPASCKAWDEPGTPAVE